MLVSNALPRRLFTLFSLTLVFFGLTLVAHANSRSATSGLILRPLQQDLPAGTSWPALSLESEVEAEVTGPLIKVTVRQSFVNSGESWAEGLYRFPLPEDATVHSLTMEIGDRIIRGIVQEKAEARRTYEIAAQAGQRASLLEENRPNMFTTSVANLGPGDRIDVTFSYLALAKLKGSTFSWIMPQVITPRYDGPQAIPGDAGPQGGRGNSPLTDQSQYAVAGDAPTVQQAGLSIRFNGAEMIDTVTSPTHSLIKKVGSDILSYKVQSKGGDRDIHLAWNLARTAQPKAHLFTETVDGEDYSLLMLVPPKDRPDLSTIPPRDITFMVDISGSMHGAPLQAAKEAMIAALAGLRPQDHFNIVTFAAGHRRLFPVSMPATPESLEAARTALNTWQAGGGTEMGAPLYTALTSSSLPGSAKQVVFVTDGAIHYETRIFDLLISERNETRLFPIGTGAGPNHWFLSKMAEYGRGTYLPLPYGKITQAPVLELLKDMEAPQLTHVALDWSLQHRSPARVPDLFGDRATFITAKKKPNQMGPLVTGRRSNGSDWTLDSAQETRLTDSGLAALWARREVSRIQTKAYDGVSREDIKAEALPIALKHQIVSPYTSFVAVEEVTTRPATEDLRDETLRSNLPAGTSAERFFAPATGTDWKMHLLGALALLTLALLLAWRRTAHPAV